MAFSFERAIIPDIILVRPTAFSDDRGFFMESYRAQEFSDEGIGPVFVQDNQSGSRRGALRGLHYQIQQAQGKLVRVLLGEVYDVAVDLRRSSASFGKWVGLHLSAEGREQVWIPRGFAHGFYVTSEWAEVLYKTTDYYSPGWERTLRWNDPAVGIAWPMPQGEVPALSHKDSHAPGLAEAELFE